MSGAVSDHLRLDARSIALHRAIAERLKADPALIDIARQNIRRWRLTADAPYLDEWESILERTPAEVIDFICSESGRATRLRQSTPFAGILPNRERWAIYEAFSARTYHSSGR